MWRWSSRGNYLEIYTTAKRQWLPIFLILESTFQKGKPFSDTLFLSLSLFCPCQFSYYRLSQGLGSLCSGPSGLFWWKNEKMNWESSVFDSYSILPTNQGLYPSSTCYVSVECKVYVVVLFTLGEFML